MLQSSHILRSSEQCLHCGSDVPESRKHATSGDSFCCGGCETVYGLLHEMGLDRFHTLKPKRLLPLLHYFSRKADFDWLVQVSGYREGKLALRVEGIQCAACVWAIREVARKFGVATVHVDPALGELDIRYEFGVFPVQAYLTMLQELGYRTAARVRQHTSDAATEANANAESRGLLLRMGVCLAIAMNNMAIAAAFYVGLSKEEGILYDLLTRLSFYLSVASMAIGGSYFIIRAYRALKMRVLHFDLPIAIGVCAAFAGSVYHYIQGHFELVYFDTVSIFIALMLLGRYVQGRFLERNRHRLLLSGDLKHVLVTRMGETLEEIPFSAVRKNDRLLIQSGGIVPVDMRLVSGRPVDCSLAWISGESMPVSYMPSAVIPAGALVTSRASVEGITLSGFDQSDLAHLAPPQKEAPFLSVVWQWVVKWYVLLVIFVATSSLAIWSVIDPSRALSVFTAILVVTCPCSLGISIPLARAMANRRLMACGVFARHGNLLDEWMKIRKIFFDKTGTLTLATLKIRNPHVLDGLEKEDLTVLFNATSRSRHPASLAIYHVLTSRRLPARSLNVVESPGEGLFVDDLQDTRYFIGRDRKHSDKTPEDVYRVCFSKNNILLAVVELEESVLEDACEAISHLKRTGIESFLLSGDQGSRVMNLAQTLGIEKNHIFGDCSPEDKAKHVLSHMKGDVLMLGDGLNDGLAFSVATLSGAPVWERSVMTDRADFFFISGSLRFLPRVFHVAQTLHRVISMNLWFALVYNLVAVGIAMCGWMTPLLAAIVMPLGSILIIFASTLWMKRAGGRG